MTGKTKRILNILVAFIILYGVLFLEGFILSFVFWKNDISQSIGWGMLFFIYLFGGFIQIIFNDTGDKMVAITAPIGILACWATYIAFAVYLIKKYRKKGIPIGQ